MSALMKKPWLKRELLSQLELHFGEKAAWLESNDNNEHEHEHAPALQDLICSGGRVQVVQFLKSSDCNVRAILSDAQFHIKAILSDTAVADMKRKASFVDNFTKCAGCIIIIKQCRFVMGSKNNSIFYYLMVDEFAYGSGENNGTIGSPNDLNSDADFLAKVESMKVYAETAESLHSHGKQPVTVREEERTAAIQLQPTPSVASPIKQEIPSVVESASTSAQVTPQQRTSTTSSSRRKSVSATIVLPTNLDLLSRHFGWGNFQLTDEQCKVPGDQVLKTHMQIPDAAKPIGYINASVFHDAALQQRQLEALKQKQQQQQQREPDVQNAPEQQQQQQSDVAPAATIDTLIEDLKAFEHEFLNDDFNIDSSGKPAVPSDDLRPTSEEVIMEEGDGHVGEFVLAYEVVQDDDEGEDEAPTTNHQDNVSQNELREVTLAHESDPVEIDDEMENEVLVVTLDHDADVVAENEGVESHAMDSESREEVIIPETEGVEDLPTNEIQVHRHEHASIVPNDKFRETLISNDSHDAVTSQDDSGREIATQYFTPTATLDVAVQNSEDIGEPYEVIEDSEDDEGPPLQDDTTKANAISPIEDENAGQDEIEKTDRVEDVVDDSDNDNEGEETPAPASSHFFETQPQSDLALENENDKNEVEPHIPTTQAITTTLSSSDPTKETELNPDTSLTSEGNLMEAFTSTQLSPHSHHQHKHLEDQSFFATSPILPRQTQSTDSPSGWTAFNPSGRVVSLEPGVTQSQYSEFEFTPTGDEESGGLEEDEGNDEKGVEADQEVEVEVEGEDEEDEEEEEEEVPLKKRVRIEEDSQTQKPWIVVPDSCVEDEIYESQEDVDGENVQEDEGEEMEVDDAGGIEEESEYDEELVIAVEEAEEAPCDFVLGGVKVCHSQYRPPNVFSLSEIVSEAFGRLCE